MKQKTIFYIIAWLLTMGLLNANAQTKSDTVYVKLQKNQLVQLQQVLGFAYSNLPTSQATGTDITAAQNVIKSLYPALVADTTKKVVKSTVKK
jgi:hypothetical protein